MTSYDIYQPAPNEQPATYVPLLPSGSSEERAASTDASLVNTIDRTPYLLRPELDAAIIRGLGPYATYISQLIAEGQTDTPPFKAMQSPALDAARQNVMDYVKTQRTELNAHFQRLSDELDYIQDIFTGIDTLSELRGPFGRLVYFAAELMARKFELRSATSPNAPVFSGWFSSDKNREGFCDYFANAGLGQGFMGVDVRRKVPENSSLTLLDALKDDAYSFITIGERAYDTRMLSPTIFAERHGHSSEQPDESGDTAKDAFIPDPSYVPYVPYTLVFERDKAEGTIKQKAMRIHPLTKELETLEINDVPTSSSILFKPTVLLASLPTEKNQDS